MRRLQTHGCARSLCVLRLMLLFRLDMMVCTETTGAAQPLAFLGRRLPCRYSLLAACCLPLADGAMLG